MVSSIHWDGRANRGVTYSWFERNVLGKQNVTVGEHVPAATYKYVLELSGCGQSQEYAGYVQKATNGNLTGQWKFYYENGQLRAIGKYEMGFLIGEWKYYHENGQLRAIGKYENGKLIKTAKVVDGEFQD